jgi:hypothetical protein
MTDDQVKARDAAIKALSPRARVALGCCAVEHVLDLYRLGTVKYRASDVSKDLATDPNEDVLALSLRHAWRFVAEGAHDAAVTGALIKFLQSPPRGEPDTELDKIGWGPAKAMESTLKAADDASSSASMLALTRARLVVSRLASLELADDDVVSDEHEDAEMAWQVRVAQRLVAHGNEPITRAMFDDLFAATPSWHPLLSGYAERCARKT